MNICNEHSAEICHEGRVCPACEIQSQLNDANDLIETLKTELAEANTKE